MGREKIGPDRPETPGTETETPRRALNTFTYNWETRDASERRCHLNQWPQGLVTHLSALEGPIKNLPDWCAGLKNHEALQPERVPRTQWLTLRLWLGRTLEELAAL